LHQRSFNVSGCTITLTLSSTLWYLSQSYVNYVVCLYGYIFKNISACCMLLHNLNLLYVTTQCQLQFAIIKFILWYESHMVICLYHLIILSNNEYISCCWYLSSINFKSHLLKLKENIIHCAVFSYERPVTLIPYRGHDFKYSIILWY